MVSPRPLRMICMPWYSRGNYSRVVEIMSDGRELPESFEAWLRLAEQLESDFSQRGFAVLRVMVEPESFLAWRGARGLSIPADAALRDLFAGEYGLRQAGTSAGGKGQARMDVAASIGPIWGNALWAEPAPFGQNGPH